MTDIIAKCEKLLSKKYDKAVCHICGNVQHTAGTKLCAVCGSRYCDHNHSLLGAMIVAYDAKYVGSRELMPASIASALAAAGELEALEVGQVFFADYAALKVRFAADMRDSI